MPKLFNLSQHKDIRRKLRQQPITCEKLMWYKLRNKQLGGYKFKRQFSIGKFVVDFYCSEAKLVIELDGATHSTDEEIENDAKRQTYLEDQGLLVKRYLNTDVKENIDLVLGDIIEICRLRSVR